MKKRLSFVQKIWAKSTSVKLKAVLKKVRRKKVSKHRAVYLNVVLFPSTHNIKNHPVIDKEATNSRKDDTAIVGGQYVNKF